MYSIKLTSGRTCTCGHIYQQYRAAGRGCTLLNRHCSRTWLLVGIKVRSEKAVEVVLTFAGCPSGYCRFDEAGWGGRVRLVALRWSMARHPSSLARGLLRLEASRARLPVRDGGRCGTARPSILTWAAPKTILQPVGYPAHTLSPGCAHA